jgi:hypothetical protein
VQERRGGERARGEKRGLEERRGEKRREDDTREEVSSIGYEGREEWKIRKAIGTLFLIKESCT